MNEHDPYPHSEEAEKAVLSCILQQGRIGNLASVREGLYVPKHSRLFNAIQSLEHDGSPIDTGTVGQYLEEHGDLESVGGSAGIAHIYDSCPASSQGAHYLKIIQSKALRRRVMMVLEQGLELVGNPNADPMDTVNKLQMDCLKLADLGAAGDLDGKDIVECAVEAWDKAEELAKTGGMLGLTTGFPTLDRITSGMGGGQLIVVGSLSGMGKSMFAMQVAQAVCADGHRAGMISLEMTSAELGGRFIQHQTGVNLNEVARGMSTKHDKANFEALKKRFGYGMFRVDDRSGLRFTEVSSAARHWVTRHDVKFLVIDYLELMETGSGERHDLVIQKLAMQIKNLAKTLNIPIMLLVQLSRKAEEAKERNTLPSKHHLKNSGGIENAADHIWFPWRPNEHGKVAAIVWGKGRGYSSFAPIYCKWDGDGQRLSEFQDQSEGKMHYENDF